MYEIICEIAVDVTYMLLNTWSNLKLILFIFENILFVVVYRLIINRN